MRRYASKIYDDVKLPTSFEQLVRLTQEAISDEIGFVRIWRGQADIGWPVHSSGYRRIALDDPDPTEKDLRNYEKGLLKRATHRGFRELDGKTLSDFELLALLQHHGAATRLVDATRSAFVALYFAAASHPNKTGLLLGLHTHFLGGYEGEPEKRSYDEIFENLERYEHPQTWEPPIVSTRVAAQHSQVLYSTIAKQNTGSLWIGEAEHAYLAIAISPSMKSKCLAILSHVFDIRYSTLFPDLDGFGKANRHTVGQWEGYRW